MDITMLTELVQGVGFPIGVAIYLLVYMKQEIRANREALLELRIAIMKLAQHLEQRRD